MRIEIRDNSVVLDGYVNVTNRESRILPSPKGRFKEQIVPKTFERALMKAANVDLLFNHDRNYKLGSIADGNLDLREDNIGLRATATVTDEKVIEKARNGELRGWSFGFASLADSWKDGEDGISMRMVHDIELFEVSVLDRQPAYIATSIEARGDEQILCENREEEFTSTIEDNTTKITETKTVEKENRESPDFALYENELTILKLKGSTK